MKTKFLPRALLAGAQKPGVKLLAKAGSSSATLMLYDEIGFWGITAKAVSDALQDLDVDELVVRINSPGGEVWDGLAMYHTLVDHKATVKVIVDGVAASAASIVAMAGDEIVMNLGTEMMIHDPWGIAIGNADVMTETAKRLATSADNLADIYTARAGGDHKSWRKAMAAETWYTAQEAVDAGLADSVGHQPEDQPAEADKARWDFSIFAHAGRGGAPAPYMPANHNSPKATASGTTFPTLAGDTTKEGTTTMEITSEQWAALCASVGVPADADADTLNAALTEALAEQADPAPAQAHSPAPGTVTLDEGTYAQLVTNASLGAQAYEQQQQTAREGIVLAAINDGRIPPARRDHWLAQLKADPEGAQDALASLAPGTIPLNEVGYVGGEPPKASADSALAEAQQVAASVWPATTREGK